MYACMYVCMDISAHINVDNHVCMYMYVCMYVQYVCMYVYICNVMYSKIYNDMYIHISYKITLRHFCISNERQ